MPHSNELSSGADVWALRKEIFASLKSSGLSASLRSEYIKIISERQVTHAENILKLNDWLFYLFYCRLIESFAPDKGSVIVDWGGLYGHVTCMLREIGYGNVTNYLLQAPVSYKLFLDKFDLPTTFGTDPNKLNIDAGSVDVFISSGTLEHVREDGIGREELVLQDIRRVIKPGGLFFIWNCPAMLGTSELLASVTGRWRHKFRYWRRDITRLMENARFEIIFMDKHKFLPGAAMGPLGKIINPVTLMILDDYLSRLFPFSVFARDFLVIARKPESPEEDRK